MPLRFLLICLVFLPLPALAAAFPADSGYLNVRDFGALGDGIHDDTAAINVALTAGGGDTGPAFWQDRIVYFPNGRYLISAPLSKRYANGRFANGAIMIGQSRDGTVITLADHTPGYTDPAHPQAIIATNAKLLDGTPTSGGKDYTNKGEGNDAFMNFVENMTIDVGAANPGAIGIDYLANNMGAIRNVLVRASDGSGTTGISLTRKWPGPALLQNITIQGFATGIDADNTEYGVTLEFIHLEHQRERALRNNHNMLAIHDLTIEGAPVGIENLSHDGLIVITGGSIESTHNTGFANLRDVHAGDALLDGAFDGEKRLSASKTPWSLPIASPPSPPDDAPEHWARVEATPDSSADATQAIRAAFTSGAHTIYFRHGTYLISENITIPPSVQRIVGMTSTIHAVTDRKPSFQRDHGMFIATNNIFPLTIEKLAFDNSYLGDQAAIEAAGSKPIILRDVVGAGVQTLLRPAKGGEAFVENTCCGTLSIAGPEGVWARQLNSEGPGVRIANNGAPLWVLGFKTEQDCTILENTNGARAELLGGLIYITGNKADPAIPAFRNSDSKFMASYVEEAFDAGATYAVHLADKQPVLGTSLPQRNVGRMAVNIGN